MPKLFSAEATQKVVRLQTALPRASASLILYQAIEAWRGCEVDANATWLQPATAFGRVLAGIFDRGMTPDEWASWSTPPADPKLRYAVAVAWRSEVLVPFADRFDLSLVGTLPPEPPGLGEEIEPDAQASSAPKVDAWDLYWSGELLSDLPFYRMAGVIVRRPPGAGVYDTWNLGRPASNDLE